MFGLFNRSNANPPIPQWNREWMEDAFRWMYVEFGEETVYNTKVLRPIHEDFPVDLPINKANISTLLKIICDHMELNADDINLILVDNGPKVLNDNSLYPIHTVIDENMLSYGGFYNGLNEAGKFEIGLDLELLKTLQPCVAAIAHENCHIILSGLKQMKEYDEFLTDLVTVYLGLGVFGANSAFNFYKANESWGYSKQGYLSEQEWGYALALFASIRNETSPSWCNYLVPTLQSEFKKSQRFISNNLPPNWFIDPDLN